MKTRAPKIMFVDDDAMLLDGVKRSLHTLSSRFEMTFQSDAEQALETYRSRHFDVVVSDLHMPLMSGLDLVSQMLAVAHSDRSRFLFLSGAGDFEAALRAINELHVYRFLQKPIVRDSLVEAIEEALCDLDAEAAIGGRHAAAALEFINAAVIVVSTRGHVLFANPAGRRLLERPGGLVVGADGTCRAASPRDTMALHQMIREAADDADERVRWLSLCPDEWGEGIGLVAIPRSDEMSEESVILMSTSAQAQNALSQEAVQELFGLSPAEAAITLALARGERLEQAAEGSGVTVSSARTYLKRVFLKTGASRQSDLVKMVLMSPAALLQATE